MSWELGLSLQASVEEGVDVAVHLETSAQSPKCKKRLQTAPISQPIEDHSEEEMEDRLCRQM